jgi:hypothetical protein
MKTSRLGPRILALSTGAALSLGLGAAHADVPAPFTYKLHVADNTVQVCWDYRYALCPPDHRSPLVRKNVATGQIMVIPQHCDEEHCFVDECVAPGTYQWGLEDPGKCNSIAVDYQAEAQVTHPLAAECAPKLGPERPAPFAGTLPWNASNVACHYPSCHPCTVGSAEAGGTALGGAAALVTALALVARRRGGRRDDSLTSK